MGRRGGPWGSGALNGTAVAPTSPIRRLHGAPAWPRGLSPEGPLRRCGSPQEDEDGTDPPPSPPPHFHPHTPSPYPLLPPGSPSLPAADTWSSRAAAHSRQALMVSRSRGGGGRAEAESLPLPNPPPPKPSLPLRSAQPFVTTPSPTSPRGHQLGGRMCQQCRMGGENPTVTPPPPSTPRPQGWGSEEDPPGVG